MIQYPTSAILATAFTALGFCLAPAAIAARTAAAGQGPVFERDVLPLLKARCLGCHGAGLPEAGLVVRTAGDLLEGGHSGPAVVPGSPEKSLLFQQVAEGRMPPGKRLSPSEASSIERWIRSGARSRTNGGGHWAFRRPVMPPVPAVRAADRVRNPIDRFLLSTLERKGLSYSPEADRRTLIRRLTYDLIGLPPTPEEVTRFETDLRPDAYERVVDRLLADPRFGERWARHWLDTAGYADSEGVLQEDRIRPNAWRYRDYVIRSFNEDRPYDRFLREQLAGDELSDYRTAASFGPDLMDSLTATGFLRTSVDATRDDFNSHQYTEYQYRMLHDTQTIVASTAMGLTLQCARCHDHKYEPLSQKDYYRVQALFAGAIRPKGKLLPSAARHIIAAAAAEQKQAEEANRRVDAEVADVTRNQATLVREYQQRALDAKAAEVPEADRAPLRTAIGVAEAERTEAQKGLLKKHAALVPAGPEALSGLYPEFKERHGALVRAREEAERKRVHLPSIRALYDQDASPPATTILIRGEWSRPGDAVEPGVPAVTDDPQAPFAIPAVPAGAATTGRRRAFALWLTRPEHPLTARVIVNRLWAHHFGAGIVATVENFGRSGAKPSNQPLLDYLAATFVSPTPRPWSLKRLHRLMVTSAAYRQSSRALSDGAADALLGRMRPRRLEAEAIRDAMLSVSGTLDPKMYGEPVATEARATGEIVPVGEDEKGRRSIYLLVRRSLPVSFLNSFDAPVMETNCTRRTTSTTPVQALALMNSGFVAGRARHFAARLLREQPPAEDDPAPDARTVERAFRLALSRPPTARERAESLDFLRAQLLRHQNEKTTLRESLERAYADLCHALLSSNEFAYVD